MPAIMMADPGGGRLGQLDHSQHNMLAPPPDQTEMIKMKRQQDLEQLRNMLIAWNANRLDLFELSMPNEVRR